MFSYLRYFSLISTVIVTLAAIGLGYYFRSSASGDLAELVSRNNKVLVQGFINNVWKDNDMIDMLRLFKKHQVPRNEWRKYRGYKERFTQFGRDSFYYFEGMPVVQVSVYDSNGDQILSINQSKILPPERDSIKLTEPRQSSDAINQALNGNFRSLAVDASSFELADGSIKSGTLIQTAMPIFSDNYVPLLSDPAYSKANNIEGAVVIFYDVTKQWNQLSRFQFLVTGSVILIFALLISTLIAMASKAEQIIAKQHDMNVELASQAATAETENQNKSQFLASISHELRTPLNAIIGFSEIIRNEVMGRIEIPQYRDYIRDIHNSGVHLLSLINDILDYSKAEAGKLELQMEPTDVTKLIQSSMRLIAPRAEEAKVRLSYEIPDEHYIIDTDSKKFKQVMLNLLSNAVKFTPEGGEVKVLMWQNVVEESIFIEVKDSGIGIAPKDISRALAPFGQVDSALSRKYEGTGLGLPLTKKFIELMGGDFKLDSAEGAGTVISFSLPLKKSPTASS